MNLAWGLLVLIGAASDTTHYVVMNHGRTAGHMTVVRQADSTAVHYRMVDRNRGTHVRSSFWFSTVGEPTTVHSWWLDVNDTAATQPPWVRLRVHVDSVYWNDERAPRESGVYYWLPEQTPYDAALLARYLLRQPDQSARLRSGTSVRAEVVVDTVLPTSQGAQQLRMVAITQGRSVTPTIVWLDERGELFASQASWFVTVLSGAEALLSALRAPELTFRTRLAEQLAAVVPVQDAPVLAIVDGDVFDSEHGVLLPKVSVLIVNGRISAVGPRNSINIPSGAHIIDATGKTVLPGMWEMHGHQVLSSATGSSVEQLARGITTVRDLASDPDIAVPHRKAADNASLLSPRLVLAGFMEGPGVWAGPTDAVVTTDAEARAWIARYDSLGYRQLKLYNLIHPDLVPGIVAEAKSRGMRVSGHVPRGLSLPTFARMGVDEVNHAAFLFSTLFPDSLFLPAMRAYSMVAAQVAAGVDVDGRDMSMVIDALARHGTVVDGTFSVWIREAGQGGPNVTGLPASVLDSLAQRSNANYLRLIRRLYDASVIMVPGTDAAAGRRYVAELETYEQAGLPPTYVLQMATIISARTMREEEDYGSITPGKVADLIIVEGRPTESVAELRKVAQVVRAGRVYNSSDLFEAVGLRPLF
jgi:imidazolonepropionase-like amidohydrolase